MRDAHWSNASSTNQLAGALHDQTPFYLTLVTLLLWSVPALLFIYIIVAIFKSGARSTSSVVDSAHT